MVEETDVHFRFSSAGLREDTFLLVRLDGQEAISNTYELQIDLAAADPDVDPSQVLNQPATVEIEHLGDVTRFQGIVSLFEQRDRGPEFTFYRAIVVPRIYVLNLTRRNRVFLDNTATQIIEIVLNEAGLTTPDYYDLRTRASCASREYTVQYGETDLAFIQRLMEYEGIFYFFEHGTERERLIIADRPGAHLPPLTSCHPATSAHRPDPVRHGASADHTRVASLIGPTPLFLQAVVRNRA